MESPKLANDIQDFPNDNPVQRFASFEYRGIATSSANRRKRLNIL
jgi:hypothetical protein